MSLIYGKMKPRLRIVPWVRPIDSLYRPGRRVSPKRQPGVWTWRPDSLGQRLRAWTWRHHNITDLAAIAIVASMILSVLYLVLR